jgi:hypothetical protein
VGKYKNPFDDWQRTPSAHFRLYFFAAVSHLLHQLSLTLGSSQKAFEQFPFLAGYALERDKYEPAGSSINSAGAWWQQTLEDWEQKAASHLPLRALRESFNLDHAAMTLLLGIGLIEEDARFGLLFESMQGTPGQQRPTVGLLNAWWTGEHANGEVRAQLRDLNQFGLVRFLGTEAPRIAWAIETPGVLWDALRGETNPVIATWAKYHAPRDLCPIKKLIIPEDLRGPLMAVPPLLATGDVNCVIIRGPERNGRRTLLGSVALSLGKGLLEIEGVEQKEQKEAEHWRLVGPLATALNALPVIVLDAAPGETIQLPELSGFNGARGLVLGKHGGVSANVKGSITLNLPMPDYAARRQHWQEALHSPTRDLDQISAGFRLTGGNIRRAAHLAETAAAIAGRDEVTISDVQSASRALNREALDTLATFIPALGDWDYLAVRGETLQELRNLEARCRYREGLQDASGLVLSQQMNAGVRALFTGPSGTGKTLGARVLAAVLGKDLYRLDLSTVVNKYIGETEKNLNRLFARAEELDVVLLLDEGDALLTQRTNVNNANDRYANLETNYLLQRLESFESILIVTSNAGERIDRAFQRRMDIIVSFPPPDAGERWTIWQLHLPEEHQVSASTLDQVAQRCELTGGQIRNAVLHASLLALNNGRVITSTHLEEAVQREYQKSGSVCPLRPQAVRVAASRW